MSGSLDSKLIIQTFLFFVGLPEAVKEIKKERARYMSRKNLIPKKGGEREDAVS